MSLYSDEQEDKNENCKSVIDFSRGLFSRYYPFTNSLFGIPIPFPVNFSRVDRIELEESADKPSDEARIFIIDDKEEIENFVSYFKGISWGVRETPACPFGLPVTFYEGRKVIRMDLGTDDCGLIHYKGYYFLWIKKRLINCRIKFGS